jgi:hypothetical protein
MPRLHPVSLPSLIDPFPVKRGGMEMRFGENKPSCHSHIRAELQYLFVPRRRQPASQFLSLLQSHSLL